MAERFEIVEKALLQLLEEKKYATLRDHESDGCRRTF